MTADRGVEEEIRICLPAVLLAAALVMAWNPGYRDRQRPPQYPRIQHRLRESLEHIEDQEDINVWVFFVDKGLSDAQTEQWAIRDAAAQLNAHARLRRLKVRGRNELADRADLPLYRPYVERITGLGCQLRNESRWLNAISVRATRRQILTVAEFPFVCSLQEVAGFVRRGFDSRETGSAHPPASKSMPDDYGPSYTHLSQITVPQLHQWMQQRGFGPPGQGVRLCLLDTGFQLDHEALEGLDVLAQWDFINDDSLVADEQGDPEGQASHGTTVLSIVGGYAPGKLIGVAYGASFLLGKTEVTGSETPIEEDYWVSGLEWAEGLGADVVSSSLGYLDWYSYSDMDGNTAVTTVAADLAASRGVVVVTAAGNEALTAWQHIIAPADGHQVIAAGAVDTLGIRTLWSSIGPTYDGRLKPDVMACGLGTYAAYPYTLNGYWRTSGTSVATPQVAGVAALLLQADSTLTPSQVGDLLRGTASRASHPDNYYGWGIVDAYAAGGGVSPPPPATTALRNYPNPFSESTVIFFEVPGPERVRAAIFTLAGELVRELEVTGEQEGRCEVAWDGRNGDGEAVADGIYLCQVMTGGAVIRGKLVRLRD